MYGFNYNLSFSFLSLYEYMVIILEDMLIIIQKENICQIYRIEITTGINIKFTYVRLNWISVIVYN